MKWHHENTAEVVEKNNSSLRRILDEFEREKEERKTKMNSGSMGSDPYKKKEAN